MLMPFFMLICELYAPSTLAWPYFSCLEDNRGACIFEVQTREVLLVLNPFTATYLQIFKHEKSCAENRNLNEEEIVNSD